MDFVYTGSLSVSDLVPDLHSGLRADLSSLYSHAQALFLIEHNPVELVATFDPASRPG